MGGGGVRQYTHSIARETGVTYVAPGDRREPGVRRTPTRSCSAATHVLSLHLTHLRLLRGFPTLHRQASDRLPAAVTSVVTYAAVS